MCALAYLKRTFTLLLCSLLLQSCSIFKKKDKEDKEEETTAEPEIAVIDYEMIPTPPNMVFVESGTFTMGTDAEDAFMLDKRNDAKVQVQVQAFLIDQTEVANIHWLEYMAYYENADNADKLPESFTDIDAYKSQVLLPDTTVWANEVAFNDNYILNYLRHPGFRFYPVVGVSWRQAEEFCRWRTLIVNENLNQSVDSTNSGSSQGQYPPFRLPTEREWEYAAKAPVKQQYDEEYLTKKRRYPWEGQPLRNPYPTPKRGHMLANFKRGRGDYAGVAGRRNDGYNATAPILSYPPNDFGLYNMAGNVNEWVDIDKEIEYYKPRYLSEEEEPMYFQMTDTMKVPGNAELQTDTTFVLDSTQTNQKSSKEKLPPWASDTISYDKADKNIKVYKGGSWKDIAYWLSPGTRRYADIDFSSASIGFRCAMSVEGAKKEEEANVLDEED